MRELYRFFKGAIININYVWVINNKIMIAEPIGLCEFGANRNKAWSLQSQ